MDARYGAIVLCGGESTRMGRDKAWLPWGDATMLQHVVSVVARVVPAGNIKVVPGREQTIPPLSSSIGRVIESSRTAGSGPLAALFAGLVVLVGHDVEAAFACAADAPLLKTEFVQRLFELLTEPVDAVVPMDDLHLYPLAAVYRPRCYRAFNDAFRSGERSLVRFLESGRIAARRVPVAELRDVDPQLDSLVNCNTPEDYESALQRARSR
jgi:molybdopterin-guanine dinucleotide biosynthesis protein A